MSLFGPAPASSPEDHAVLRVYTLSDLRRRGWTARMVHRVLGPPDWSAPNPYGGRAPQRLFARERVLAAEERDHQLRARFDETLRRRAAASATSASRRLDTLCRVATATLRVWPCPAKELLYEALLAYGAEVDDLLAWEAPVEGVRQFEAWVQCNHARRSRVDSTEAWTSLLGVPGRREGEGILLTRQLAAVASTWPHLADEANRQWFCWIADQAKRASERARHAAEGRPIEPVSPAL